MTTLFNNHLVSFAKVNETDIELSIDRNIYMLQYDSILDITLIFDAITSEYLDEVHYLFNVESSIQDYPNKEIILFIIENLM
jgi:hypothetical protein